MIAGAASTAAPAATDGRTAMNVAANDATGQAPSAQAASERGQAQRDARERPVADFAALLASGDATAAAASARAPETRPGVADTATPAETDTPEQLLYLLDGSWLMPAAPRATPAAPTDTTLASSASLPATAQTALPIPATPAANPLPPADVASTGTEHAAEPAPFAGMMPLPSAATDGGDAGVLAIGDAAPAADASAAFVVAPSPAATPARSVVPTAPLNLPPNPQAGFDDGLGTGIAWMAEQRIGHAEIRLNPEHVGPIEVRVQVDGNRVDAEFHSNHVEVRQAIEASVPRLREMLGQHGLQLG